MREYEYFCVQARRAASSKQATAFNSRHWVSLCSVVCGVCLCACAPVCVRARGGRSALFSLRPNPTRSRSGPRRAPAVLSVLSVPSVPPALYENSRFKLETRKLRLQWWGKVHKSVYFRTFAWSKDCGPPPECTRTLKHLNLPS